MAGQADLFDDAAREPEGLVYREALFDVAEEAALTRQIAMLPFAPFEFHGFLGKRRTVSFGLHYAFDGSGLAAAAPLPDFLLPVRTRAAAFAGLAAEQLEHALVIEYAPGAGIGWHRDRPVFGHVIGLSLLAPARLRFRRRAGERWDRRERMLAPRSAYLLRGPAREMWEHSIPPMDALRYSITFRTLRTG